jgi:L-seryl-tRNA(Ser) seleniumtransferase
VGQIQNLLRKLPGLDGVLEDAAFKPVLERFGRELSTRLLRRELERLRKTVLDGADLPREAVEPAALAGSTLRAGDALLARSPVTVVNAGGVVVHTNLGRSLLGRRAADRVAEAARGYMTLEYDLETGARGSRMAHFDRLMDDLFPGYGFLIVNNNAAAILIALKALAAGHEVVVSRGELVEIGGSFRVPDIFAASGAVLREVGTTNRTRVEDFTAATGEGTAAWLKVHTSNFKIVGFTEEPMLSGMVAASREKNIPLIVDWGSGDLADLSGLGIRDEMPVTKILEAGADVVTFSGDKLLGGPQAGFAVGKPELIAKMRKDPLSRVCRLDRLKICALQETLAAYVRGTEFEDVPTLKMLALTPEEIGARTEAVMAEAARLGADAHRMSTRPGVSRTGGGSSPTGERPTTLLAVAGRNGDESKLERQLRTGSPAIIARVQDGDLLLDLRTVLPDQDGIITRRLAEILRR